MIEAELFDGTILEFPDDTPDEVIDRVAKRETQRIHDQRKPEKRRIIEFGGRRIDVPGNATDDDIRSILMPDGTQPEDRRDQSGVPGGEAATTPTAVQPVEDDGWLSAIMSGLDYADDTAAIGLTGARQGASTVLGLPVDAVNNLPRIANLIPGVDGIGPISEKPFLGSEYIDAIMGAPTDLAASGYNAAAEAIGSDSRVAGSEGPVARDALQRIVRRTGQEVGAAAVPVGGALFAAGRMGVDGARAMGGPIGKFIESAAVNRGIFAGKEAAVAGGAGTGAGIANEALDPSTAGGQLADLVGAIMGASGIGLAHMVARGTGNVLNAVRQNPNYVDQVVSDAVTDRIGRAAGLPGSETADGVMDTQTLVDAIMAQRDRPSDLIPGYKETLSDATGNAGIASLEYGRAAGPSAGAYNALRMRNNDAVDVIMGSIEPKETPGSMRAAVEAERNRRLIEAITGQETAQRAAEEAVRNVTPTMTRTERGNTVREGLEVARDTARQRTEEAYRAAGVGGVRADPAPLTQALERAVSGLTEAERNLIPEGLIARVQRLGMPAETGAQPTGILDASGNPITRDPRGPDPIPLDEATTLKSELQRLQRAAMADPRAEKGGRNAARVLGDMIKTVDGYIGSNLTPEQQAALDTARGAKFDEAEAFTRQGDPVARALGRYEGGQPQVADERVAGLFVEPRAMDRLFAQADTPDVRAAIRDEVLSKADMRDAGRINQFQRQYAEQLNRFPGLSEEISRAAQARSAEATAGAARLDFERIYGTPGRERGTGTVGRYLQFSDATSERAIAEVLASKDPARAADELVTFVGDNPKAVEGARAAFWQKLKAESQSTDNAQRAMSGKRQWRGDWLKSWLDNPSTSAVAERLYHDKPADLEKLRALADVLDNADLRTRGKAAGTSGTGQGVNNILTPETLQSRTYAWMRGQVSGTYLATSIAAVIARRAIRNARGDAIERLTDKALLNPDFAMELLKDNNPANRAALARKAKGWLGNEASTFVNLMNEDDDETTKTIMEGR